MLDPSGHRGIGRSGGFLQWSRETGPRSASHASLTAERYTVSAQTLAAKLPLATCSCSIDHSPALIWQGPGGEQVTDPPQGRHAGPAAAERSGAGCAILATPPRSAGRRQPWPASECAWRSPWRRPERHSPAAGGRTVSEHPFPRMIVGAGAPREQRRGSRRVEGAAACAARSRPAVRRGRAGRAYLARIATGGAALQGRDSQARVQVVDTLHGPPSVPNAAEIVSRCQCEAGER